jgi:hypothetical protein
LEVGSWKLEVGSWKVEAGSGKLEVGSWKVEVGRKINTFKEVLGVFKKVCHFFFAGISLKAGGRKAYPCKFKDIFHNGFQNVQLARVGWVSN